MLEQLAAPVAFPVSLASAKEWVRETTTDSDAVLTFLLKAATARVETVTHRSIVYRPVREYFDCLPSCLELSAAPVLGIEKFQYVDSAGVTQTIAAAGYQLDAKRYPARVVPPYSSSFPTPRSIPNAVWIQYDVGMLLPIAAVDAAGNTLTVPGANKVAGDMVQLSNDGDAASTVPTGLAFGTVYYVVNPTNGGDTFQVAATEGGPAIDITAAGAGVRFVGILPDEILLAMRLMIDSWFRNRSSISPSPVFEMPREGAAEALLAPFKVAGFA